MSHKAIPGTAEIDSSYSECVHFANPLKTTIVAYMVISHEAWHSLYPDQSNVLVSPKDSLDKNVVKTPRI